MDFVNSTVTYVAIVTIVFGIHHMVLLMLGRIYIMKVCGFYFMWHV